MSSLEQFGAYQKARELFDLVVEDTGALQRDSRTWRLVSQQVASADSICANMEEGYGRISRAEYRRFLDFSRGSARETQGRYERMKHWLSPETIAHRVRLLDEIIGILTRTIQTLRREGASVECRVTTGPRTQHPNPPPDTRHPTPDTLCKSKKSKSSSTRTAK